MMRRTLALILVSLAVLAPTAGATPVAERADAICQAFLDEGDQTAPALRPLTRFLRFSARLGSRRAAELAELPASPALRELIRAGRTASRVMREMRYGAPGARLARAIDAGNHAAERLGAPACVALQRSSDPGSNLSPQGVEISQAIFARDGSPLVVANTIPYGGGSVYWRVCTPGGFGCDPADPPSEVNGVLEPGPSVAGTTFEAFSSAGGQLLYDPSDPWRGRIELDASPKLLGAPQVGATVTPVAATWVGGWGGEFEDLRVQVCPSTTPVQCVPLSAPLYLYPHGDAAAVVPAKYEGWYLFAADQRLAKDTAFATVGYWGPENVPPLKQGPTTALSAPLGPITSSAR